jgi:Tfp pilus assembly protein PilF
VFQAQALIFDLRPIVADEEPPMNCQPPQNPGNSASAMEGSFPQTAPAIPQPDVAELLGAGLQHHQAGRLADAEADYRRILHIEPDHADGLHLLGGLAYQTGRPEAAIELIGRAIESNNYDPSYHCSRGLVLQSLDRLDEAVANYDHALLLNPDYALALINRGLALETLERCAEAVESYDRALAIEPDFALAWLNRGITLQELGGLAEALESYDRVLALRPDHAEALLNRASILQELDRFAEATASYDRAVLPEDLLVDAIDTVIFTATTNCNIRCTYCAVSLPTYVGDVFDFSRIEMLADEMARMNVRVVQINGHGETTMLPAWETYCGHFLSRGIEVCITSNFSRIFSEVEIDALARMSVITISIDTVDRELLRRVRRKVDLRTIIYNMQAVRLRALTGYNRYPVFNWQCTLSDLVARQLCDWVQMGLLNGVKHFTLGNLIELPALADVLAADGIPVPRHVAELERDDLVAACEIIREARRLAVQGGAGVTIQPGIAEGIGARLAEFGMNTPVNLLSGTPSA